MGSAQLPKKVQASIRRSVNRMNRTGYRAAWDRGAAMALNKADARRMRLNSLLLSASCGLITTGVLFVIMLKL